MENVSTPQIGWKIHGSEIWPSTHWLRPFRALCAPTASGLTERRISCFHALNSFPMSDIYNMNSTVHGIGFMHKNGYIVPKIIAKAAETRLSAY